MHCCRTITSLREKQLVRLQEINFDQRSSFPILCLPCLSDLRKEGRAQLLRLVLKAQDLRPAADQEQTIFQTLASRQASRTNLKRLVISSLLNQRGGSFQKRYVPSLSLQIREAFSFCLVLAAFVTFSGIDQESAMILQLLREPG